MVLGSDTVSSDLGIPGAGGGAVFQVQGLEDGVLAQFLLDSEDLPAVVGVRAGGRLYPPSP